MSPTLRIGIVKFDVSTMKLYTVESDGKYRKNFFTIWQPICSSLDGKNSSKRTF